jgi:alkanesulfonate monooxygenase SsuD/methylene tetrahydromethanopterin reductase-like flavin-dependent oxidoreductase (luciferase family)
MRVGVGLPAAIPNVPGGSFVLEWAKRAEELGFSSLGLIDRVVYSNYESLVTFAAVAGVTNRIRLMTTILLVPTRDAALLAKQAATIDRISGGRLTLGLGIGSRKDDFDATEQRFNDRGKRFERQLALMKKIWNGERVSDQIGSIGPIPIQKGGPELLIGGYASRAIKRISKYADGYIAGSGGDPKTVTSIFKQVEDSWRDSGRKGRPRLVCSVYYGLGRDASSRASSYLRDYYGGYAERLLNTMPATPEQIKEVVSSFSNVGADELMLFPTLAEMEQLELLSEALPKDLLG